MNHRMSDRYLKMWENKGEVICRNMERLTVVLNHLEMPAKFHVDGNMAFISVNLKEKLVSL